MGTDERWLDQVPFHPRVVAEFDDQALLTVFAADGIRFFAVPSVIAQEVARRSGAEPIGGAEDCRETFFAITAERKVKHPAVVAITEASRQDLFG